MTKITEDNTLFLIIDIQEKLINAAFNKDKIERNANILSNVANILRIPTIITEQYPKGLGSTIECITNNITNAECYEKITFSALDNQDIRSAIQSKNKKNVVIFGIETHICVYQSVIALLEEYYNVIIINDACGSRSEFEYLNGLSNMNSYGAKIKTTEMIIFELLKSAKHPKFKEIQALIK